MEKTKSVRLRDGIYWIGTENGYMALSSLILKKFVTLFGKHQVSEIIENLSIEIDRETLEITDYNYKGDNLWNIIFEKIAVLKGLKWLIVIEPFVKKLSAQYEVPMPKIFTTIMKETYELNEENEKLRQSNLKLEKDINETKERLTRCSVTGLYNFEFLEEYLTINLKELDKNDNPFLIVINIDNMAKIRFSYGDNEVDETLKKTVYLIEDVREDDRSMLFRLQGAAFAWYFPNARREDVLEKAEKVRNAVYSSEAFIENITLSIGVVSFNEIRDEDDGDEFERFYNTAMLRVKLANTRGKNAVCSTSSLDEKKESLGKILLVDIDEVNLEVLKTIFENLKYEVLTASDGETALKTAEYELPDAIISEVMLPRMDAFTVRENLLMQSNTKDILFIIVSHLKNEDSIKRALSLRIEHYFKKPIMLSELLGIIKLKIKGGKNQ